MPGSMTVDAGREKSVIKVTQISKLQAVTTDRLCAGRHAVPVAVPADWTACLSGGPAPPLRSGGGAYLVGRTGRLWPVTSSDALTGSEGTLSRRKPSRARQAFPAQRTTPSAGSPHKWSPALAVSGSTRPSPMRTRCGLNGARTGPTKRHCPSIICLNRPLAG
jgi:hypothetical protein